MTRVDDAPRTESGKRPEKWQIDAALDEIRDGHVRAYFHDVLDRAATPADSLDAPTLAEALRNLGYAQMFGDGINDRDAAKIAAEYDRLRAGQRSPVSSGNPGPGHQGVRDDGDDYPA